MGSRWSIRVAGASVALLTALAAPAARAECGAGPDEPAATLAAEVRDARASAEAEGTAVAATSQATLFQKATAWTGIGATAAIVGGLVYGGAFGNWWSATTVGLAAVGSWFLADIGTGIGHHFLDNLDPARWPAPVARVAREFQGHHDHPREFLKTGGGSGFQRFAYQTADTQRITTPVLMGLAVVSWWHPGLAPWVAGGAIFANAANLAQQFHMWSHMTPAERPLIATLAQKAGLIVPPRLHAMHHTLGHKSFYALLNGKTNWLLDDFEFRLTPGGPKTNLLRKLEVGLWKLQGSQPNAWVDNPGLAQKALGLAEGEAVPLRAAGLLAKGGRVTGALARAGGLFLPAANVAFAALNIGVATAILADHDAGYLQKGAAAVMLVGSGMAATNVLGLSQVGGVIALAGTTVSLAADLFHIRY